MKPQEVKFFKIEGNGYDNIKKKWANEDVLDNNRTDTVKIPSDIKPGMYIFRTELLALHGNSPMLPKNFGGPQFYTHCFNVEITGNGSSEPAGVLFPGAYKPDDAGVKFYLGTGGATWENYVSIPKHDHLRILH
jgi:cellulase